jgi:uncharacterized protein YdeI (YjbR/CyaY-like superfamily)
MELPVLAFPSSEAWEDWLAGQPDDSPGVWLKLAKKTADAPCVGKSGAIEGALRHDWIDGQLGRFDAHWFLIRFTPRKPRSKWSANNRKTAERLIDQGRMSPRGMAEVERAKADGRWDAAYPSQSKADIPADLKAALDAQPKARALF